MSGRAAFGVPCNFTVVHELLRHQIEDAFGENGAPDRIDELLALVSLSYRASDDERRILERSLELTSVELLEQNAILEERKTRLRGILDALPDHVFVIERDHIVQDVRETADLLPADIADQVLRATREVVANAGPTEVELSTDEAGSRTWFEARMVPLDSDRVLVVLRDITRLRRMREQLLISERMASIGIVSAEIAHEINNPLTYVLTNLDHVIVELERLEREHGIATSSDALEALVQAREGARRVSRIVRDLRVFGRGEEAVVPRPTDVHAALDSAANLALTEIGPRAQLKKEYGQIPPVEADAARLAQVFLNLIVNAAQSVPLGHSDENRITAATRVADDGWVEVTITDTGRGIPDPVRERVWDAFFTTKETGDRSGLGLAICRNIVESFGGAISFHSDRSGTTFRVRLPAATGEVPSSKPPRRSSLPVPAGARARVLIIDDEEALRRALGRILGAHDVSLAENGREGWERLEEGGGFDIILCDLLMPHISGIELYRRVLEERPDIAERFVFMTGGAATPEAREFLARVDPPLLEKPFDMSELLAVVSASVAESS